MDPARRRSAPVRRLLAAHLGSSGRRPLAALAQLALRVENLTYERPGGGRGHASLSAVPLVDEDRELGAVLILEDTTRAVALEEGAKLPIRGRASAKRAR